MSTYSITVDWDGKDALADSATAKIISGDDFQTEFETVQTALNSKADLTNSGQDFTCDDAAITGNATITGNTTIGGTLAVTGVPTVPTQTAGNNTTRVATTAFVTTAVADKGMVLQHRIYTFGTSTISTTSSTYQLVGSSFTFTPQSSSSQLILNLHHYGLLDRSNTNLSWVNVAVTINSTSPTTEGDCLAVWKEGFPYASGVDQNFTMYTQTGYYDNSSTDAITFRLYYNSNDNTRTAFFHHADHDGGKASFVTISEIDSSITDSS